MDEKDIILALVRRAEGGNGQAAVRLHKMYAAGVQHPALNAYREWPKTGSRHKVSARPRGVIRASDTQYDADGNYIPRSDNTGMMDLRNHYADSIAAMALALASRPDDDDVRFHGDALYDRAAEVYHQRTGRFLDPEYFRKRHTRQWLALGRSLLSPLRR